MERKGSRRTRLLPTKAPRAKFSSSLRAVTKKRPMAETHSHLGGSGWM